MNYSISTILIIGSVFTSQIIFSNPVYADGGKVDPLIFMVTLDKLEGITKPQKNQMFREFIDAAKEEDSDLNKTYKRLLKSEDPLIKKAAQAALTATKDYQARNPSPQINKQAGSAASTGTTNNQTQNPPARALAISDKIDPLLFSATVNQLPGLSDSQKNKITQEIQAVISKKNPKPEQVYEKLLKSPSIQVQTVAKEVLTKIDDSTELKKKLLNSRSSTVRANVATILGKVSQNEKENPQVLARERQLFQKSMKDRNDLSYQNLSVSIQNFPVAEQGALYADLLAKSKVAPTVYKGFMRQMVNSVEKLNGSDEDRLKVYTKALDQIQPNDKKQYFLAFLNKTFGAEKADLVFHDWMTSPNQSSTQASKENVYQYYLNNRNPEDGLKIIRNLLKNPIFKEGTNETTELGKIFQNSGLNLKNQSSFYSQLLVDSDPVIAKNTFDFVVSSKGTGGASKIAAISQKLAEIKDSDAEQIKTNLLASYSGADKTELSRLLSQQSEAPVENAQQVGSQKNNRESPEVCTSRRLDEDGMPASRIPVAAQNAGDCYARAAATVADIYRFQTEENPDYSHLTSAAYAAIHGAGLLGKLHVNKKDKYLGTPKELFFEGGREKSALNAIRKYGSCNSNMDSNAENLHKEMVSDREFYDYAYRLYREQKKLDKRKLQGDKDSDDIKMSAAQGLCHKYPQMPENLRQAFSSVEELSTAKGFHGFLKELAGCKDNHLKSMKDLPEPRDVHISRVGQASDLLFKKLMPLDGPIRPSTLGICSGALYNSDPNYYGNPGFYPSPKCSGHAVTAVGMKSCVNSKTGKTKKYLIIQDSNGTSCDIYKNPKVKCLDNNRVEVEFNHIVRNLMNVTYLPYQPRPGTYPESQKK